MRIEKGISRRNALEMSLALAVSGASGSVLAQAAQLLRPTQPETMGPFYPDLKPLDQDGDLTLISGKNTRAQGELVQLNGRVLNRQGQPVVGARIEIWQANTHGRYDHPRDGNPAPLDPNFQGFAVQFTDAKGRYQFKTIKPGAYQASSDWLRPPHIHVTVTSKNSQLVTQMYFPDDPLNKKDLLLQQMRENKEGAIAKLAAAAGNGKSDSINLVWDIVLA